jgi:phosphoenolpyruvate carboxykinase (GTP)
MLGSETTAAATGAVGVLRRDPMAMLPFCGYNMASYWGHWLEMGRRIPHPPRIFHVNWFRKGADGKFLWPGYGENVRVLKWMLERIAGNGKAVETPIGYVPTEDAITLDGLDVSRETMRALLSVDPADWVADLDDSRAFFDKFGGALPAALREEHGALRQRLERVLVAAK